VGFPRLRSGQARPTFRTKISPRFHFGQLNWLLGLVLSQPFLGQTSRLGNLLLRHTLRELR